MFLTHFIFRALQKDFSCGYIFRFSELREQRLQSTRLLNGKTSRLTEERTVMGLDLSLWEDSYKGQDRHKVDTETSGGDVAREALEDMELETREELQQVTIRERPRTLEDPNQRTRAKRESRRMRELEQAKFSLELLKVRSTGGTSPSDERRWSMEMVSEVPHTPQGTPDSQSSKGSFELLNIDECIKDKASCAELEDLGSPSSVPDQHDVFPDPASRPEPPRLQNSLPTFYLPLSESSSVKSSTDASAPHPDGSGKPLKERRESARRPMVVVISMQKETVLSEEDARLPEVSDSAVQTSEPPSPAQPNRNSFYVLEKLEKLNEEKEVREKHQQQQNEKEMMEQVRQQKHILKEHIRHFAQLEREMFEKQRFEALQRIEQSRQEDSGKRTDGTGSLLDRGPAPIAQPEPDLISQPQIADKEARYQPKDGRKVPEGWAPKLTLESRGDEAKRRINKKPYAQSVNMTDRPGNIFFSPKTKVSISK